MQHHMSCDIYDPINRDVFWPFQLWLGNDGNGDELVVTTTIDGVANVAQQLWLELPILADKTQRGMKGWRASEKE